MTLTWIDREWGEVAVKISATFADWLMVIDAKLSAIASKNANLGVSLGVC